MMTRNVIPWQIVCIGTFGNGERQGVDCGGTCLQQRSGTGTQGGASGINVVNQEDVQPLAGR